MKNRKNKKERVEGNLELTLVVENSEALKKAQQKKWIVNNMVIKNQKKGWLH